jgi:hypothetical protein
VQKEDYDRAAKIKEEIRIAQTEFDTLRTHEMDREDMEEYVYLRALSITQQLLRYCFCDFVVGWG